MEAYDVLGMTGTELKYQVTARSQIAIVTISVTDKIASEQMPATY